MKWWLPVLVAVLALFAFAGWTIHRSNDYEGACAEAGGVVVKSYPARVVCVDRDALIEVREN